MRILFCMMPAHGHMNPTLPVAGELIRRGADVAYLTTADFADNVRRAGATVQQIDDAFGPRDFERALVIDSQDARPTPLHQLAGLVLQSFARTLRRAPELIEQVRSDPPDLIVYDPMCLWGRGIAQALHIPAVTFSTSFAINKRSKLMRQFSSTLRLPSATLLRGMAHLLWSSEQVHRRYNIPRFNPTSMFAANEGLNIVPLPRAFQPDADAFDDRFVFVGPSITTNHEPLDPLLDQLGDRPLLYISLGSTVLNTQPAFFQICFEAFADTSWQVVLVAGTAANRLGAIPPNILVRSHVPQLEILRRTAVFITHGGMNSTMEALWFGVPLVVVPQMFEQAQTAARVAELGLGVQVDPTAVNASLLRAAVERVTRDPGRRDRAVAMQQDMREAGGAVRAADAVQAYVQQAMAVHE